MSWVEPPHRCAAHRMPVSPSGHQIAPILPFFFLKLSGMSVAVKEMASTLVQEPAFHLLLCSEFQASTGPPGLGRIESPCISPCSSLFQLLPGTSMLRKWTILPDPCQGFPWNLDAQIPETLLGPELLARHQAPSCLYSPEATPPPSGPRRSQSTLASGTSREAAWSRMTAL